MKNLPLYDSGVPKNWYDSFGEKEWTRLSRNRLGELLFHVHMDVFRYYVKKDALVLELGAGAGIFSKELVTIADRLEHISKMVSDKNNNASQMNESEVILKETIIPN